MPPFQYTATNKLVSLKHTCGGSKTVPPEHVRALNSSTQPRIDASLLVGSRRQAKESQMTKGGEREKESCGIVQRQRTRGSLLKKAAFTIEDKCAAFSENKQEHKAKRGNERKQGSAADKTKG